MLVTDKKKFRQGTILFLSFAVLFWVMLLPIFHDSTGSRQNSLQYADTVFNELAKGSSWFIPEVLREVDAMAGKPVRLSINIQDPAQARVAIAELKSAGVTDVKDDSGIVSFSGDFGAILRAAATDSADLYHNDGRLVSERYGGEPPLLASAAWWHLLNPCVKALQKQGMLPEAKAVEMVVKKAIEPGNNFYGIPSAAVSENIFLICALLAFYLLYAVWYGFAIYRLFEGLGLLRQGEAKQDVEASEI